MKKVSLLMLAIMTLAAGAARALPDPLFEAKLDYPTGTYTSSVATSDLNGDGKLDLVATNLVDNTVSVLLGIGAGGFGLKSDFSTGGAPLSVAIADLNGDGVPDLAVANSTSNTVSVLLGVGNGTFGAKTDFNVGVFAYCVAIGDLNGDGKPDLAVVNGNSHTVSVLLGNGNGSFGTRTDFGAGRSPTSVAISDLNGDGKLDLVVANGGSYTVSVLIGDGAGGFSPGSSVETGATPYSVAISDLNGDGKLDLVTANGDGNSASVMLGDGSGGFGAKTDFATGTHPNFVAVADLNGDGKPDLALANIFSNTVSLLFGDGSGTFGTRTDFATGTNPISLAIGDLNGDGKPDLAIANATTNSVSVLLRQALPSTTSLGSGPNPCVVGTTVTLTATVTPSAATGTVTFMIGSSAIGTGTLSGGIATMTTSSLSAGSIPLYARYEGDATYVFSTSSPATTQVMTPPTSTVSVGPAPGMITLNNAIRTVPVTISRTGVVQLMAYSVVFSVPSPLAVSGGLAGIHQGTYLSAANPATSFNLIDLGTDGSGNHSYQTDCMTLGSPYGSTAASGTLFTIDLSSSAPSGSGTVTITSLALRDWANYALVGVIGSSSSLSIDQSAPAAHLIAPNGGETWHIGSPQTITWTGSDPEGVAAFGLSYSIDGGATYPYVIESLPGIQTSYAWTVPVAPGSGVRVRVTPIDANGNFSTDASDANFTIAYYGLTYAAGAGGVLTGSNFQPVAYNGSGTQVTAVPNTGYHFTSWSDGVLTAPRTDLNVTSDVTVTAGFAINTYTLAYAAGTNGTISGTTPQSVAYNGSGTAVTAVPNTGYHFTIWSDGVLTAARTDAGVTADKSLTASFAINTYTLTYAAGVNGTISGTTPQTVNHGADGTLVTAAANSGYHFTTWSDAVATAARAETNVTANVSVTASFVVNPPVSALTHLTATQNRTDNPAGSTTGITLSWDVTANTVEVWRAGFGHYPEYSDAGGSIPTASTSYPPGVDWTLTTVTAPGGIDYVTTRDYYYYVAYQRDSYGTWSVAATTTGTLNYHLGDVSNGSSPGTGNNLVGLEDISTIGAHYGISGAAVAGYAYLDVGPTTNMFVDGLPTTDDLIGFEDLVMFAINYHAVSAPMLGNTPASATDSKSADNLVVEATDHAEPGTTVTARLTLHGSEDLVALSSKLAWDPVIVEPTGYAAGEWLTLQNGVALSAAAGTIDAVVMQPQGMTGEGVLATVTFRVLSAGDPRISIASADGRDVRNQKIAVANSLRPAGPTVTRLAPSRPNPFNKTATVSFGLARTGPVEVALYSVDGRRVRALARDVRGPGAYTLEWDGRDDNGNLVATGVYFLHLTTEQGRFTRTVTYLK